MNPGKTLIGGWPKFAPMRLSVTAADRERMREIERAQKRKNVTTVLHVVL
jgi:hypothetical protein